MNKSFIITVVLAVAFLWIISRHKKGRIEMIDWLNINVSGNGEWVKMTDEELRTVYKPFAMIKNSALPNQSEYLKAVNVLDKYGIKNSLIKEPTFIDKAK